jgi:hypothetical protein
MVNRREYEVQKLNVFECICADLHNIKCIDTASIGQHVPATSSTCRNFVFNTKYLIELQFKIFFFFKFCGA